MIAVGAIIAASSSAAFAGGFSRGSADIDVLFDEGRFSTRNTVTYVDPNRTYNRKPARAGVSTDLDGREFSDSYVIPSLAAKVSLTDGLACAATYTVSNGGSSDNRGLVDNRGKLKENFTTDEYGLTCAYGFDAGPGRLSIIGGAFYEEFGYDLSAMTFIAPGVLSPLKVDLDDGDIGWRAGVAYEIPDIAMRTSLVYRSGTSFTASGTSTLTDLGISSSAAGWGELPQSVELKAQTGIAPGWLVLGSLKWTDWSVMERLHLRFGPQDFYNEYHWRDGFTVSGGVAHSFSEAISGFVTVAWDRGVSTGWDLYGDTVTVAVGGVMKDAIGGEFRLTAAGVWLAPEQETVYGALSASSQSSWGYAIQAQYKLRF